MYHPDQSRGKNNAKTPSGSALSLAIASQKKKFFFCNVFNTYTDCLQDMLDTRFKKIIDAIIILLKGLDASVLYDSFTIPYLSAILFIVSLVLPIYSRVISYRRNKYRAFILHPYDPEAAKKHKRNLNLPLANTTNIFNLLINPVGFTVGIFVLIFFTIIRNKMNHPVKSKRYKAIRICEFIIYEFVNLSFPTTTTIVNSIIFLKASHNSIYLNDEMSTIFNPYNNWKKIGYILVHIISIVSDAFSKKDFDSHISPKSSKVNSHKERINQFMKNIH
jgi:hypothetical protein